MATKAGADNVIMIYRVRRYRCPGRWKYRVTRITCVAGINMIYILSTRGNTIVTGKAIVDETCVINRSYL